MQIPGQGAGRLHDDVFRIRRRLHGTPGHVTLLDKSNVLRSNAFMRKVFDEVAAKNPDIGSDRLYIDAGSMMFVTNPERYDVVVTEKQWAERFCQGKADRRFNTTLLSNTVDLVEVLAAIQRPWSV